MASTRSTQKTNQERIGVGLCNCEARTNSLDVEHAAECTVNYNPNPSFFDRLEKFYGGLVQLARRRGIQNEYGDALGNTGGYMNTYAIAERKQDRLRNQVWSRGLRGKEPHALALETIRDEINYLTFLLFQIEDLGEEEIED